MADAVEITESGAESAPIAEAESAAAESAPVADAQAAEAESAVAEAESAVAEAETAVAEAETIGSPSEAAAGRNRRKSREGTVLSASMDRTAVVLVTEQVRHRRYNKTVRRHKRLYVHDEDNDLNVGDRVRVTETRPLSKLKRWRLVQVLERAR